MNKQPLVSVFLPYYNDADYLSVSIESVLKQTYENWELILCNHASTDNCREIAHSYNDARIKHVDMARNEGAGSGLVFDAMLNAATGKYIKTLCADDALVSDCLETMVDFMESNPNIDFAFGNLDYVDENGDTLNDTWFDSRSGFSKNDTEIDLIQKYINGISMLPYIGNMSKRDIFNKIEINKTLVMMFDMSLWLQLLCTGHKIAFVDKNVAKYRIHSGQMSASGKEKLAMYVSWFESRVFFTYLMNINNVELAKRVFADSLFVDKLSDVRDIPFFVAHSMFNRQKPFWEIPLDKMLNDDATREHLMSTFGFGVRELRDLRKADFKSENHEKKSYKNRLYYTSAENLDIFGLIFLLVRRTFHGLTLSKFRKRKQKQKKKYSL